MYGKSVLVLALMPLAAAQDGGPEAVFHAGINEVEVPVVVRDGRGGTVAGLSRSDFRVYDNGKLQVISRFSAVDAASRGAGAPRFSAYLLGDVWIHPNELARARDAVMGHMEALARPEDRAALFCVSGRRAVDFTDDAAKLREALAALKVPAELPFAPPPRPRLSPYASPEDARSYRREIQQALDAAAEALRALARQSLDGLRRAIYEASLMPGERQVIVLSSGFPVGYMGGGRVNIGLADYEDEIIRQAIRLRVTVSCVDLLGVRPGLPVGAAESGKDVLVELARGTGGTFIGHNDLVKGLRQASAPEHSYLLAFSPQDLKRDGSLHKLKVSVRGHGGANVEARLGYVAPKVR